MKVKKNEMKTMELQKGDIKEENKVEGSLREK